MFVFSLIFVMVAVSYSWFYEARKGEIEGVCVEVMNANNLLVKPQGGEWTKQLILSGEQNFEFGAVAGDGKNFYSPKIELVEVSSSDHFTYRDYQVTGMEAIKEADLSKHIFRYDLSFMIEQANNLCLYNSVVERGEDPNDPRGYAAAALRVAFQMRDSSGYRTVFVWIPDVMTKIEVADSGVVNITREQETEITLVDEKGEQFEIAIEGEQGSSIVNGVNYVWGDITDPVAVAELGAMRAADFRLVVWVDGLDRDCVDPIMSSNVLVKLNFTAVAEEKVE